ncbi:hypothetical protein PM082_007240 [Marasmius tenuissimus]|nr:hypothetical protein PM082_007240 [Marasmius tenuissimus]
MPAGRTGPFPPEILWLILHHLVESIHTQDDKLISNSYRPSSYRKELKRLSLVSKAFLLPCRFHLFRTAWNIDLVPARLLEFIELSCNKSSTFTTELLKELKITSPISSPFRSIFSKSHHQTERNPQLWRARELFGGLTKLTLDGFNMEVWHAASEADAPRILFEGFTSLKTLVLLNPTFHGIQDFYDVVTSFPSLETLDVAQAVRFANPTDTVVQTASPTTPSLRSISFDLEDLNIREFIPALRVFSKVLTHYDLVHIKLRDFAAVGEIISLAEGGREPQSWKLDVPGKFRDIRGPRMGALRATAKNVLDISKNHNIHELDLNGRWWWNVVDQLFLDETLPVSRSRAAWSMATQERPQHLRSVILPRWVTDASPVLRMLDEIFDEPRYSLLESIYCWKERVERDDLMPRAAERGILKNDLYYDSVAWEMHQKLEDENRRWINLERLEGMEG